MAIPYLPPEITTSIFLRLDLKTLISLKFVNKLWLQLITSPGFAKAHVEYSEKDEALSGHRFILTTVLDGVVLTQFSIESSSCDNSVNLDYPKDWSHRGIVLFVGYSDGLVCNVMNMKHYILWNPCTGKYEELRPLDLGEVRIVGLSYGFGYDKFNDDYKVVVLCYFIDEFPQGNKEYHCVVKVNSLKRNYWKTIDQDFKGGRVSGFGKIASEKVHWLAKSEFDVNWRKVIVSFDLGSEVFGIVEPPSYGDGRYETTLDVLDGCICLLLNDNQTRADLWVMKEYGVKESWTKVVTISCNDVLKKNNQLSPCSMLPNGEILFSTSKSFAVYNPKDDSFKFTGILKNVYSRPTIYVPSLVSPVAGR